MQSPSLYAQVLPHLERAQAGETVVVEQAVHAPHGDVKSFQAHYIPDIDAHGNITGVFAVSFDTTALTDALHKQEINQRFLQTITDNLPVLITYFDCDKRIVFANATVEKWFGIDATSIVGQHMQGILGEAQYVDRTKMIEFALSGNRVSFDSELQVHGQYRLTHTTYVPDVGKNGEVRGVFSLSLDVTESKAVEKKLEQLARQDGLTGLPNRTALDEVLPLVIARSRRTHTAVAIMFLDVDFFKKINDEFGHGTGDRILVEFADRLKKAVRMTDSVYRIGGDEFVIVMEHVPDNHAAVVVAEKVLKWIRSAPFDGAMQLKITTSIGVFSCVPGDDVGAKCLLENADTALYLAKAAGRDQFHAMSD